MNKRALLAICYLERTATIDLAQVVSGDPAPKVDAIVKAMTDEISDVITRAAPHYIRPSKRAKRQYRN